MRVGVLHTAFIGDLALCGLLFEALKVAGHQICLVSTVAGCRLFAKDSRINSFVPVSKPAKKGILGTGRLLLAVGMAEQISRQNLDVLLVPHKSATSSIVAWIVKSRGPKKIATVGYKSAALAFLFSKTVERDLFQHECLRLLKMAEGLTDEAVLKRLREFGKPILQSHLSAFKLFESLPFLKQEPYFMVFPGSVWATKKYPTDKLAEVCFWILRRSSTLHCVISGGAADEESITAVFQKLEHLAFVKEQVNLRQRLHVAISSVPLDELSTALSSAKFCIVNDSGPMHVASGVACPTVAIFGPTDWRSGYGPVGERCKVVSYNDFASNPKVERACLSDAEGNLKGNVACHSLEEPRAEKLPLQKLSCQPCSSHGHVVCPKKHFRCMNDLPAFAVIKAIQDLQLLS